MHVLQKITVVCHACKIVPGRLVALLLLACPVAHPSTLSPHATVVPVAPLVTCYILLSSVCCVLCVHFVNRDIVRSASRHAAAEEMVLFPLFRSKLGHSWLRGMAYDRNATDHQVRRAAWLDPGWVH